MSTLIKSPPSTFTKYEDLTLPDGLDFTAPVETGQEKLEQNCGVLGNRSASSVLLRNDHVVLWAIDGLLVLHAAFKKWRQRKRTVRALADLDERQLRDIGLTREQTHFHALAELEDARSEHINSKLLGGRK